MFFFLSKVLDLFLAPLTWSLFFACAGLWVFWRAPKRRRLIGAMWGVGLAIVYVFSLEFVSNALTRTLEDETSTMKPDVTYDVVVLLGGVVTVWADQPEGRRSYNNNVERLLAVYDVLRTDHAKVAIITGGHPDPRRPESREAPTQGDQLADWGIARDRLILEPRARNTYENAVETKKLVDANGWKSVLVVTSAHHMGRALGCFRAVGLPVDSLVVDRRSFLPGRKGYSLLPRATPLDESTDALRELAGRLVYRLRGYAK